MQISWVLEDVLHLQVWMLNIHKDFIQMKEPKY